jgi:hypothetical protein
MHRKICKACSKSLSTLDSAVLMDRDGRTYHLTCWSQLIDNRNTKHGRKTKPPRGRVRKNGIAPNRAPRKND